MSYVPDRPPAPYHPPYPPAPANVLGIVGFVLSLVAVITAGVLSPIALLISGIGLLKPPRAFAVAGVIISCLGTVALIAWVSLVVAFVGVTQKVVQTNVTVMNARNEIYGYANRHGGRLPSQAEGDRLVSRFEDAWGNSLRYDAGGTSMSGHIVGFRISSAGRDGRFGTPDDQTFSQGY